MTVSFIGCDRRQPHPRFAGAYLPVELDDEEMNLNNANARALLGLLGLEPPIGEASVLECQQAIARARRTFDVEAPRYTREAMIVHGAPRANEDGTIELRPIRAMSPAFDVEDLRARLDRFARVVEALAAKGATHIVWG